MKVYKITDKDGYTRMGETGETKWGENVTHKVKVRGYELCSHQVIHCYKDPYLAVFMNPSHANYDPMLLWEAKTPKIYADNKTKSGCKTLTTVKQITVPVLATEQRVEISIRCALKVYKDDKFQEWALNWISNKDRSWVAAWAAARAARAVDVARTVDFNLIDIIREVVNNDNHD